MAIAVAFIALIASTKACTIYSLPGAKPNGGQAGLIVGSAASAEAYCKARGGSGAGQIRTSNLTALPAATAYDLATGAIDTAASTVVLSGVECTGIAGDATPACATDARGNYGYDNGGSWNFGTKNGGASNVGNGNGGSGNIGDNNGGDGTIGNNNANSGARVDLNAFLATSPNTVVVTLSKVAAAPAPAPAHAKAPASAPAPSRKIL